MGRSARDRPRAPGSWSGGCAVVGYLQLRRIGRFRGARGAALPSGQAAEPPHRGWLWPTALDFLVRDLSMEVASREAEPVKPTTPLLVVTGAAATGKSTIGDHLRARPDLFVIDGDVLGRGAAAMAEGRRDYVAFWRYVLSLCREVRSTGSFRWCRASACPIRSWPPSAMRWCTSWYLSANPRPSNDGSRIVKGCPRSRPPRSTCSSTEPCVGCRCPIPTPGSATMWQPQTSATRWLLPPIGRTATRAARDPDDGTSAVLSDVDDPRPCSERSRGPFNSKRTWPARPADPWSRCRSWAHSRPGRAPTRTIPHRHAPR